MHVYHDALWFQKCFPNQSISIRLGYFPEEHETNIYQRGLKSRMHIFYISLEFPSARVLWKAGQFAMLEQHQQSSSTIK